LITALVNSIRFRKSFFLVLLLIIGGYIEFYQLGTPSLMEFDEARYAANAYEMMHNGDYINLHYRGQPDAWVARPPLKAWFIMAGYTLFGYNEWGLRFSSGIAILLFLFFCYRSFLLYYAPYQAFLACLLLITSKGIIGFHVGRTADMDAELIAFLSASFYFFLRYMAFEDKRAIYYCAFFTGLAFWLKTTACFYYVPGFLLYVFVLKKQRDFFSRRDVYYAMSIFIGMVGAWVLIQLTIGVDYSATKNIHEYSNSLQTTFVYDTWNRFTASHFDGHVVESDYFFLFHHLDSIYNVWNYIAYGGLGLFLYFYVRDKEEHPLVLLSICVLLPIALLLTFGMHKLMWYIAPALFLLTVLAWYFIHFAFQKNKMLRFVFVVLLGYKFYDQTQELNKTYREPHELTFIKKYEPLIKPELKHPRFYFSEFIPQHVYAYLLWKEYEVLPLTLNAEVKGCMVFSPKGKLSLKNAMLYQSNKEEHLLNMQLGWVR
jgi:4-amino-4-deoxy-L-arabinose transferase-like glycosyltransferase